MLPSNLVVELCKFGGCGWAGKYHVTRLKWQKLLSFLEREREQK